MLQFQTHAPAALALVLALGGHAAHAQNPLADRSGRLLLTGGVTQVEGAAGGGLSPWALIGRASCRERV